MLLIENGDIFESKCDAIVCPTNTVGVMGKGLALEFKNRYPKVFKLYKELCSFGLHEIGKPVFVAITEPEYGLENRSMFLFPTKIHWKNPSKIEYIQDGLNYLAKSIDKNRIKSIGWPLIGCGLGGLNESDVLPLIEKFEKDSGIVCEVYRK